MKKQYIVSKNHVLFFHFYVVRHFSCGNRLPAQPFETLTAVQIVWTTMDELWAIHPSVQLKAKLSVGLSSMPFHRIHCRHSCSFLSHTIELNPSMHAESFPGLASIPCHVVASPISFLTFPSVHSPLFMLALFKVLPVHTSTKMYATLKNSLFLLVMV